MDRFSYHSRIIQDNVYALLLLLKVKAIEERDSVLTSKQQIDRLNRPGSTYFNLNPFDVSNIEHNVNICFK